MKKKKLLSFFLVSALIVSSFFLHPVKKKIYYSDRNNFVDASGVVSKIFPLDGKVILYLKDLQPFFDDQRFVIEGESAKLVIQRGIFKKIAENDHINFVSATRYFGDGYYFPIAAIELKEETILSFDEGYPNLQNVLRKEFYLGWFA